MGSYGGAKIKVIKADLGRSYDPRIEHNMPEENKSFFRRLVKYSTRTLGVILVLALTASSAHEGRKTRNNIIAEETKKQYELRYNPANDEIGNTGVHSTFEKMAFIYGEIVPGANGEERNRLELLASEGKKVRDSLSNEYWKLSPKRFIVK